jgi:hypothetical protein
MLRLWPTGTRLLCLQQGDFGESRRSSAKSQALLRRQSAIRAALRLRRLMSKCVPDGRGMPSRFSSSTILRK